MKWKTITYRMPSRYPTNPETLERKLRETGAEGR
jgi:hypothetical protein